ncbi:hypothetical protein BH09PSE6_BH09PSE6_05620 [soil metagenome]
MSSFHSLRTLTLIALSVAAVTQFTPAEAATACAIQRSASNALVITSGCMADAGFKSMLSTALVRTMAQLDAPAARGSASAQVPVAAVESTAQDKLRTINYLNRTAADLRAQQRNTGGVHYYGQDD